MTYRLWVNDARTIFIRMWDNGKVEVALREPGEVWGPPVVMVEEKVL